MPSALEYFEKCAGTRLDNYIQGGTGFGAASDLARTGTGVAAEDLDPEGLNRARHRGRALEAIGSIGLGTAGALGLAGYEHPMNEWFDSWDHTGHTLRDMAEGSGAGLVGGLALPAIGGHMDTKALVEEAQKRKATGDQAPPMAATNVPVRGITHMGGLGSEVAPQQ